MLPIITHTPAMITLPVWRRDEAAILLARAFADYPLMRFVFGDLEANYQYILEDCFRFLCEYRMTWDGAVLGSLDNANLVGSAVITAPDPQPWPERLKTMFSDFLATAGSQVADRLGRHSELVEAYKPQQPHFYLGILGVLPEQRGRGHARMLLDALHSMSEAHPASTGVFLSTENPLNVRFYQRFGYHVVGRERLGPVPIFCMFRPNGHEAETHIGAWQ